MTGRLRVRPITFQVLAVVLVASLAPASNARAAAQQYPPQPSREPYPADNRDWSDQIPGHVSAVDGAAELERDGQRETAVENVPLLAGDRLRTARGRVEVLFSDGSALALDQFTDVDLLSDSLLRMERGRIRLMMARGASELAYRVDAAGTTTWLRSAGEYRIVVDERSADPDVFVTVLRGAAELESAGGRTAIRTGYESRADARNQPSVPYAANVSAWDDFDRWVDAQQRYRTGVQSAQYLPAELRHYSGAFDHDGAWAYEQGYGYVWYPTVAVGWRPYYYGGWSFYGSFGWMWVGGGRWNWPTHHYGRWGVKTGRWYWIPGRHWSPAWVAWGSAPGYYGWCPLGFDNRAVVSFTNVNVYNGSGWNGWTVVPANRFGPRYAVSRYAVAPQTLNLSGGRFAVQTQSPARVSGVTRQVEPLRAPTYSGGRYAVPRSVTSSAGSVVSSRATPSVPGSGDSGRSSTVRSAGPGSRSAPASSESGDGGPADRPAPTRSAVPRSRVAPAGPPASTPDPGVRSGPNARPSSGQSSGQARPRSMASSPAPPPTASGATSRRPETGFSGRLSGSRSSGSRDINRWSASPRAATSSYSAAPRLERSAPARPDPGERRATSRTFGSAPTRAPQVERSTPAPSSPRSAPNSRSAEGSSTGGRQARSRNGR